MGFDIPLFSTLFENNRHESMKAQTAVSKDLDEKRSRYLNGREDSVVKHVFVIV